MVLDSGSSPLLAAPGRVPAETVLPKKTLFFSLSENGGGEDTHADAGRALSSGVCASWRSSAVLGAGDLFVAQALFLALFRSPLSRKQGEFIGEQRFVTGRMDPLAIPADSLRLRKRLLAVDTHHHCQLLVFVCAHRNLQEVMGGLITYTTTGGTAGATKKR